MWIWIIASVAIVYLFAGFFCAGAWWVESDDEDLKIPKSATIVFLWLFIMIYMVFFDEFTDIVKKGYKNLKLKLKNLKKKLCRNPFVKIDDFDEDDSDEDEDFDLNERLGVPLRTDIWISE